MDGELEVGGVLAAGVQNMQSGVGRLVFAVAGHHRAEEVATADDEPELFAGMESQPDRK
ncbi:hypothetical protein GCM10027344_13740 [Spelaeicoccus albus]|uniref:Uncharacterized protein n=1 Tax=Spelaeicoccus albus TaxID=1280376 RepID=A0A7Z0D5C5_9MICO|nr:hypothetical protein [Spelaeicoccus albus]